MPDHESTILKNAPGARFIDRTRTGDWVWAEQMLTLGFGALTEVAPQTSWAVAAAGQDTGDGRIALRLAHDLVTLVQQDRARLGADALKELGLCVATAIDQGNVPFLTGFDALFAQIPPALHASFQRFASLAMSTHNDSFTDMIWTTVVIRARQDPRMDRAPNLWAWVQRLPGYHPEQWNDPTPGGLRTTLKNRLGYDMFHEPSAPVQRSLAFMDSLGIGPALDGEPDLMDHALDVVRKWGPLDQTVVSNGRLRDSLGTLQTLIEVLAWGARATPPSPSTTLDGRDLLQEGRRMAGELAQRRDSLERWAKPLLTTVTLWEGALLRQAASPEGNLAEPRHRVRL